MGSLGLRSDEFYDLSPREFWHAMNAFGEVKMMESRNRFEVARYNAVAIINYTSTILKERIKDERKVFPLPWDAPIAPEEQSPEQLLEAGKHIARAFKAVEGGRKPGDPPTVLARIHKKDGGNS